MIARLADEFVACPASEIDATLQRSLAAVGEALGADVVTVHQADELVGRRVSLWARVDSPEEASGEPLTAEQYPWSAAQLLAGRPVLIGSSDELPPEAEGERLHALKNPGAFASWPLRVGDVLIGAITTRWLVAKPEWTPSVRARLGLVAHLVSLVLHRRMTERRAEDQRRFDSLVARISTRLAEIEGPSLDEAILEALGALAEDRAAVRAWVRDARGLAAGGSAYDYEWRSPSAPSARESDPPLDALPALASHLHAGRSFVARSMGDSSSTASAEQRWMERNGIASLEVVPLRVGNELLGALSIEAGSARSGTTPLLSRSRLVGELFANALHRRNAARARAERRRFEELLSSISTLLIQTPGERLDDVLRDALEQLRKALGLVRVVLSELEDGGEWFRIVEQAGSPGAFPNGTRTRVWPGQIQRMMERGFLVLRLDELGDARVREGWAASGSATSATIVLFGPTHARGLLTLVSTDPTAFEGDDFEPRARLLQDVIGSALARRDAELARRRSFEELAQLKARIERERDYLREEVRLDHDVSAMVVESAALTHVLDVVDAVTATTATVLIRGETGVGKELIARAIHARSPRADAPLVKVNCAGIPRELFDSEFFGHVRGSFTGAHRDRAGRFELADRGTIFLDEVGEIPIELQAKLLRVLQEGELERVGDDRVRKVDVRIIAATNRDLEADVAAGLFRSDLYYRLSVFPIEVPPLRERPDDVLPLARHYLARFAREMSRNGLALSRSDEERLLAYPWPGNVRELAHVIERAVILSATPPLRIHLTLPRSGVHTITPVRPPAPAHASLVKTHAEMRELEKANLVAVLERASWRVGGRGGAAELFGVSASTFRDRMRAFQIEAPDVVAKPAARKPRPH